MLVDYYMYTKVTKVMRRFLQSGMIALPNNL